MLAPTKNSGKVDKFENIHIRELEKLYTFSDCTTVIKFILDNSFLLDLLLEAAPKLRKFFPSAEFRLYVENIFKKRLVLRVYSDLSMDEDEKRIFAFDRAWWIDNLNRAKGLLGITA